MQSIRTRPTPTETVRIRTVLSICGTLAARTCKSGSATVMAAPSRKLTSRMTPRRRLLVSFAPIRLPMRDMDISAPSVNRPIPAMSSSEPIRNASISPASTGTSSRQTTSTIAVTGRTEAAASRSFSVRIRLCIGSLIYIHIYNQFIINALFWQVKKVKTDGLRNGAGGV